MKRQTLSVRGFCHVELDVLIYPRHLKSYKSKRGKPDTHSMQACLSPTHPHTHTASEWSSLYYFLLWGSKLSNVCRQASAWWLNMEGATTRIESGPSAILCFWERAVWYTFIPKCEVLLPTSLLGHYNGSISITTYKLLVMPRKGFPWKKVVVIHAPFWDLVEGVCLVINLYVFRHYIDDQYTVNPNFWNLVLPWCFCSRITVC